jgi:predicted transcriptional regulator
VELAILELLAQHGPLDVDRMAETLNEPESEVGGAMWLLAHPGVCSAPRGNLLDAYGRRA